MRRSDRSRTKSLKAELEDSAQSKYKSIQLMRRRKSESEGASIRTHSDTEEAAARDDVQGECEEERSEGWSQEEDCNRGNSKSHRRKSNCQRRKVKEIEVVDEISSESYKNRIDLKSEQAEEQYAEREDVGAVNSEGRWRHYPALCASLPGRERQIHLLLTLLGEVSSCMY